MKKATILNNTNIFAGFFEENNIPENRTVVSDEFDIRQFIKAVWVNSEWIEGGTTEEIQFQVITQRTENIKLKYEIHRANGWNTYQEFRAKVVSDIYDGLITETEAFLIEENLSPAFDQISTTGDFKTARYKLSQIIPLPQFVEPYYDYAMQIINDYIINNYED